MKHTRVNPIYIGTGGREERGASQPWQGQKVDETDAVLRLISSKLSKF